MDMPKSTVEEFFDTKAFDNWRKQQENRDKNTVGICDRLNEVIRGCNAICKTVARTR